MNIQKVDIQKTKTKNVPVNIQNKKQWFLMMNDITGIVREYESTVLKYKKTTNSKIDLSRPLRKKFYKNDSVANGAAHHMVHRLRTALLAAGILWVISFIIFFATDSANAASGAIKALIVAGITLFIVLGAIFGFTCLGIKNLTSKLDKLEDSLYACIKTIPPSYRSSEKLSTLTEIYFTKQSLSLNSIFEVCDDWLINNQQSIFHSIMFDVDYTPLFDEAVMYSVGTTESASNEVDAKDVKHNPNLPADIESRTFSGSKDSKKDLEAMIGLESVKQQIIKLENRIKFYGANNNNGNHMQFLGSAGTGKTSVARIITKILFDLGYIKNNQYVEISGDYLKSGSSERASAIIEYAIGGVLFIDEAYLLYDKNGNSAEATGVLLKAMEDRRSEFVVILAGYEEQMTKLIASNEGFSSRIKHTIYFPDYTVDEMIAIFNYFISNYNGKSYSLEIPAIEALRAAFEAETRVKSFGNARTVRNAVDAIMDYYADRHINDKNPDRKILEEDVLHYYEDRKTFLQHEMKNSSAANHIDESIISLAELKPKLKIGSDDPEAELDQLVGMEDLKQEIMLLKNQKEFYNEIPHQRILLRGECSYNRETIMRIITGSLYKLGYITDNKFLDISAEFMKGSYVGHTSRRADGIISYASGGVLVISNLGLVADGNSLDSFNQEVINSIMTAYTENQNVTVVIFDDDKSDFVDANIAPVSTIVYEFPAYDVDQFYQVFVQYASNDNFNIDDAAADKIYNIICNTVRSVNDLANFYNKVKKNHIANFDGENNKYTITEDDVDTKATLKLKLSI